MEEPRARIQETHPLAIRWFHWLHFPILATMIWSGLLIYWAEPSFLLPRSWIEPLGMGRRLAEGMAYHFAFAWLFAINGIAYALYLAFSGAWRDLTPGRGALGQAWQVALHDIGLRKEAPAPGKYNAAQRLAYSGVIVMGAGSLLSGLALYKPFQLSPIAWFFGSYQTARLIHFILTVGFLFFFLIHVLQVARAGWNNFRSMLTGRKLIEPEPAPAEEGA